MTEPHIETPADFEQAMQALEALVTRMETGDLPLEQTVQEFQRGMGLVKQCQDALDTAQRRVEHLLAESQESQEPQSANMDSKAATKVPEINDDDGVPF